MSKQPFPPAVADTISARSGGMCETWIAGTCNTRAVQIHHRKLRSQGGRHTVVGCIHICHRCHDYIHSHPRESYANGWLVSAYADPAVSPVLRRGLRTLLRDDGRVLIDEEE